MANSKTLIEQSASYLLTTNERDDERRNLFTIDDIKVSDEIEVDLVDDNDESTIVFYNPNNNERNEMVNIKVSSPFVKICFGDREVFEFNVSLIWPNNIEMNKANLKVDESYDIELNEKNKIKIKKDKKQLNETIVNEIYESHLKFDEKYYELTFRVPIGSMTFKKYKIVRIDDDDQKDLHYLTRVNYFYPKIGNRTTLNPIKIDSKK